MYWKKTWGAKEKFKECNEQIHIEESLHSKESFSQLQDLW
jgi:hypothetical protein